jgi:hypothetical protein
MFAEVGCSQRGALLASSGQQTTRPITLHLFEVSLVPRHGGPNCEEYQNGGA